MDAPLTETRVESTTEARSHRNRNTFPPAACGTWAGRHDDLRTGSWVRSIVTLYRYAFEVPSTRSVLCSPRTLEKSTPMYVSYANRLLVAVRPRLPSTGPVALPLGALAFS